nr:MAG TPA: hypothetical protein [Caudoviricetes sp.]
MLYFICYFVISQNDTTTMLQRYIDIYYDSINNIYDTVMTVLWYGLYYAVNHYIWYILCYSFDMTCYILCL